MSDATYTKADIDAAVKEAVSKVEDTLGSKRDELLDELKKAKVELRKSKDIDPADLTAAEERADKAETELKKVQGDLKKVTGDLEKAQAQVEQENGFTSKLLTENALNDALSGAGVKETAVLKAVKAMMAPGAKVVVDGEDRKVMVGDKPVADYVKEWAATDEAKHFISAPGNNGGGAPGGKGGNDNTKTMTRLEYDEKAVADPAGVQKFIKDGGKVTNDAA